MKAAADDNWWFWVLLGGLLLVVALAGCTFIGFNRAPVTTSVQDDHAVRQATNAHVWDMNISPR